MAILVASYDESAVGNRATTLDSPAFGESFTGDGSILDSVKFNLSKFGSPAGNIAAKIYAHTGTYGTDGTPIGDAIAASDSFDVSSLTTTSTLTTFMFSGENNVTLVDGTHYFTTIEYSVADNNNFVFIEYGQENLPDGNAVQKFQGDWIADTTSAIIFYVYGTTPITPPTLTGVSSLTGISSLTFS